MLLYIFFVAINMVASWQKYAKMPGNFIIKWMDIGANSMHIALWKNWIVAIG